MPLASRQRVGLACRRARETSRWIWPDETIPRLVVSVVRSKIAVTLGRPSGRPPPTSLSLELAPLIFFFFFFFSNSNVSSVCLLGCVLACAPVACPTAVQASQAKDALRFVSGALPPHSEAFRANDEIRLGALGGDFCSACYICHVAGCFGGYVLMLPSDGDDFSCNQ